MMNCLKSKVHISIQASGNIPGFYQIQDEYGMDKNPVLIRTRKSVKMVTAPRKGPVRFLVAGQIKDQ